MSKLELIELQKESAAAFQKSGHPIFAELAAFIGTLTGTEINHDGEVVEPTESTVFTIEMMVGPGKFIVATHEDTGPEEAKAIEAIMQEKLDRDIPPEHVFYAEIFRRPYVITAVQK